MLMLESIQFQTNLFCHTPSQLISLYKGRLKESCLALNCIPYRYSTTQFTLLRHENSNQHQTVALNICYHDGISEAIPCKSDRAGLVYEEQSVSLSYFVGNAAGLILSRCFLDFLLRAKRIG